MKKTQILSIGEAMLELSEDPATGLMRPGFAGDTLNTAWYLRALLPESFNIAYLTRVGTDALSARMVHFIAEAGIDTSRIEPMQGRTIGLYMIHLNQGERSFTYWRGQSAARHLADDPDQLRKAMRSADTVYLSGITLAILPGEHRDALIALVKDCKASGTRIVFDPNIRPSLWPDVAEMRACLTAIAAHCSIVLPSFDDEATVFGDASPLDTARRYLQLGAAEVAVKNGGGQMALGHHGAAEWLPQWPAVTTIDATGAGDSFNAAYLAARETGAAPEEAAEAGHRLASQVIGAYGAILPANHPALRLERSDT